MTPQQDNIIADKLVMLFSADWFKPHWKLTGFWPRLEHEEAFQIRARALVGHIIDGADTYWEVSFASDRLSSTRADFVALISDMRDPMSDPGYIGALINGIDTFDAITELSMRQWNNYEKMIDEVKNANLVDTEWDRYLLCLTGDLPSLLQDFTLALLTGGVR